MAERIAPIDEYTRRNLAFLDRTKPVLGMGATGPAVIVIHEF
jgi:hypothetical protein